MFLGGLILALAVEHSGLHLRIALNILVLIGVSPAKVQFLNQKIYLSDIIAIPFLTEVKYLVK